MDLGFAPLSPADATPLSLVDEAGLTTALVAAQANRADDGTELAPTRPLAPTGGAFSAAMAARLVEWRHE